MRKKFSFLHHLIMLIFTIPIASSSSDEEESYNDRPAHSKSSADLHTSDMSGSWYQPFLPSDDILIESCTPVEGNYLPNRDRKYEEESESSNEIDSYDTSSNLNDEISGFSSKKPTIIELKKKIERMDRDRFSSSEDNEISNSTSESPKFTKRSHNSIQHSIPHSIKITINIPPHSYNINIKYPYNQRIFNSSEIAKYSKELNNMGISSKQLPRDLANKPVPIGADEGFFSKELNDIDISLKQLRRDLANGPVPVWTNEGKMFYIHKTPSSNNNCGFFALLGLNKKTPRAEAIERLLEASNDETVRKMIAPEIKSHILSEEKDHFKLPDFSICKELLTNIFFLRTNGNIKLSPKQINEIEVREQELNRLLSSKELYMQYVKGFRGIETSCGTSYPMLSYCPDLMGQVETGMMDALAYLDLAMIKRTV